MIKYSVRIVFIALIICAFNFLLSSGIFAQTSTNSAEITDESLSQSIKDRIQRIATQSSNVAYKRRIAFIGTIQKLANETITIKSAEDIHLASVSAKTTYARMPNGTNNTFADVSIGDFAVAMGFINGSQVLETKRILLYDSPLDTPKKTSVAGRLKLIDEDEDTLTITSEGEDTLVELTRNTILNLQSGIDKVEITAEDLKVGQYIAVIYVPTTDEYANPKALSILATSTLLPSEVEPSQSDSATPSASPASDSGAVNFPAELGR